jgi:hypothetical protein
LAGISRCFPRRALYRLVHYVWVPCHDRRDTIGSVSRTGSSEKFRVEITVA